MNTKERIIEKRLNRLLGEIEWFTTRHPEKNNELFANTAVLTGNESVLQQADEADTESVDD